MNTFGEKLPPNNLVDELLVRKKQLEASILSIEKFLEVAPAGRLRISTNKGTLQYYQVMPAGITSDVGKEGAAGITSDAGREGAAGITSDAGKEGTAGITSDAGKEGAAGITSDAGKEGTAGITSDVGKEGTAGITSDAGKEISTNIPSDICKHKYLINGKYIPKKNETLVKELAQKNYSLKIISSLKKECELIKSLTECVKTSNDINEKIKTELRKNLIEPLTLPDTEYISRWLSVKYQHKSFTEDLPELFTAKGERVRSKSEVIIADTLTRLNVPYRYEFPVALKNVVVHPDFCCLNVRTRKEYLWEHFGMMSDMEYSEAAVEKMMLYQTCGIFPGANLLISMETQTKPISSKQIEQIVKKFLM